MPQLLSYKEARGYAEAGFDFLNNHPAVESDWAEKMSRLNLDLQDCNKCVLGRLNGVFGGLDYRATSSALGIAPNDSGDPGAWEAEAMLGFNLRPRYYQNDYDYNEGHIVGTNHRRENWHTLGQAWRDLLDERTS